MSNKVALGVACEIVIYIFLYYLWKIVLFIISVFFIFVFFFCLFFFTKEFLWKYQLTQSSSHTWVSFADLFFMHFYFHIRLFFSFIQQKTSWNHSSISHHFNFVEFRYSWAVSLYYNFPYNTTHTHTHAYIYIYVYIYIYIYSWLVHFLQRKK